MRHVQQARDKDVAHPEDWLEAWTMESWTDHLREADHLSGWDRQVLAWVGVFHAAAAPLPCR